MKQVFLDTAVAIWQLKSTMRHRHITNSSSAKNVVTRASLPRPGEQGQTRTVLLALVCVGAGIALSVLWFNRGALPRTAVAGRDTASQESSGLSETTKAVLQHLNRPVDVRFYSLLDPSTVPDSLPAFAGRVDRLLSAYESAANGRLKVARINSQSYAAANAASADGIKGFNLDKGNPCFLGIAVALDGHTESIPSLAPAWEPALEADLTRAIGKVVDAALEAQAARPPVPVDTAALEAVKRAITNLDSISEQQGVQFLRETALTEFAQATREMEAGLKEAQTRLDQAQTSQSASDQAAVMKQLQQLQADQTERLKQIAARSQAQIQALQQYKSIPR